MHVTSCDEFIEMNNFISWAQCESTACKIFMLDDPSPYHQFPTVWHHPEDLLNLLQDTVSIPLCGKNCAISFITQNLFVWWYHGKDGWCWSSNWSMWTDEKGGRVLWGFSLWWPWVDLSLSATYHRRQLALRSRLLPYAQAGAAHEWCGGPWLAFPRLPWGKASVIPIHEKDLLCHQLICVKDGTGFSYTNCLFSMHSSKSATRLTTKWQCWTWGRSALWGSL